MHTLISLSGVVGAALCVGMYAAVSMGRVTAERPPFFVVNAIGATLVFIGAAHEFDVGDLGTVAQEIIWAIISVAGAWRAWGRESSGAVQAQAVMQDTSPNSTF